MPQLIFALQRAEFYSFKSIIGYRLAWLHIPTITYTVGMGRCDSHNLKQVIFSGRREQLGWMTPKTESLSHPRLPSAVSVHCESSWFIKGLERNVCLENHDLDTASVPFWAKFFISLTLFFKPEENSLKSQVFLVDTNIKPSTLSVEL